MSLSVNEIRQKYLDFCKKNQHVEISPASLLAEDDPTLLFTNSGMFPLVPFLLGEKKHPAGIRLTNTQRCFRTDDIDEVGDHRHTTMFEMLGNWSLGDYFKQDQLRWCYQFLFEELKLDPTTIYSTVFAGNQFAARDEESIKTLQEIYAKYGVSNGIGKDTTGKGGLGCGEAIDFSQDRIFPYVDKNWWQRGDAIGELGGPDSEIFYDTGKAHDPKYGEHCHVNCDCGRFVEIGNSVFMQFKKTAEGWEELAQKNVDFGGGLERMAMAVQRKDNMFATDVFSGLISALEKNAKSSYVENIRSYEIIVDHLRASLFLIADGAVPSNKDQGYYVRRVLRRAMIHLHQLGIEFAFVKDLIDLLIEQMGVYYQYLNDKQENILLVIDEEMSRFAKTLDKGMKYFNQVELHNNKISGLDVFNLVTTYGFPFELIKELAVDKNWGIDEEDFRRRFVEHQNLSRQGADQKFKSGLADTQDDTIRLHTATHLLHRALRQILGEQVEQKGSNITPERLRFDFSYPEKMTDEQVKAVEDLVNQYIQTGANVYCEEMSVDEAMKSGAIGLFKDRYDEQVSVYTIAAPEMHDNVYISKEICRGPHVKSLGDMGHFKILKEEACSAGIRRIKAILE